MSHQIAGRSAFCGRGGCGMLFVAAMVIVGGGAARAKGPLKVIDTPNIGGVLRTIALGDNTIDANGPFFQSLGTNGRSCGSCHEPLTGWSISPLELQARFEATSGMDPVFRTVDGSNSPNAPVGTINERRAAYSMLLKRGVIRVGLPIPAGAEFDLVAVDDPYNYASGKEVSLFRRPLPTTNLRFLTGVMWDGRESFGPMGTTPILSSASALDNATALFNDLTHQANDATTGHAQGAALSTAQREAIARFELNLATAQRTDLFSGRLDARGALGGPENLALQEFYVTINDVLGADVVTGLFGSHSMTLFDGWAGSNVPTRAAIARGAALFGAQRIDITGVGGLNDDLNAPTIRGSCTTCHDSPNVGNHSVALPIDIGLTDASRRTADRPLYTLKNRATGQTRQTTDPGRAMLTGKWKDIGKFKGPVLRGLASRPPYFHDGSADDFLDVIEFYDTRFGIRFTDQEKVDLALFLNAL
jgi:cytochrome c peroxidase